MTQEQNTPRWIIDPGHGWLAVSLAEYPDAARCGTGYGYQKDGIIYLEEDCEAGEFLRRHPEIDAQAIPEHVVNGTWEGRRYPLNARRFDPFASRRLTLEPVISDADGGL